MTLYGLPLFLEDTTGHINGSNYADIYDRRPYLHLALVVHADRVTRYIYDFDSKPCKLRYSPSQLPAPVVTLAFGPSNSLGTVAFGRNNPVSMERYMKKTGGTLERRFRCSDGAEYTWTPRTSCTEWTCINLTTRENAGSYDLKPPNEPVYRSASGKVTSGNVFSVEEKFQHLTIELLASLTIMRHIAAHGV